MTDDEYIRTANFMERKALDKLEQAPGHFATNYWEAVKHLAKAYYHADTGNQEMLREQFEGVFDHFDSMRRAAA